MVLVATVAVIWKAGPRPAPAVAVPVVQSAATVLSASPVVAASASAAGFDVLSDPAFDGLRGKPPGSVLSDGTAPPELPANAPARVRFGVIVVRYRGAQGAGFDARTKKQAWDLAQQLLEQARENWPAAVARGDGGSLADAGGVPRDVLEPAPNYVLFTLPAGEVAGPVDTPTGFWIVKNLGK